MSLMSHVLQRRQKLPEPQTRRLRIDRNLRVPMRDGVDLLADRSGRATRASCGGRWPTAFPPQVKAMIPVVTESALTREFLRTPRR